MAFFDDRRRITVGDVDIDAANEKYAASLGKKVSALSAQDKQKAFYAANGGAIYLNEPTVKQLNEYHNNCAEMKGKKITVKKTTAAVKFFDAVFDEAINVEVKDETGSRVPLTKDTLKHVPPRRKQNCVEGAFLGLDEDIDVSGEEGQEAEEGEEDGSPKK